MLGEDVLSEVAASEPGDTGNKDAHSRENISKGRAFGRLPGLQPSTGRVSYPTLGRSAVLRNVDAFVTKTAHTVRLARPGAEEGRRRGPVQTLLTHAHLRRRTRRGKLRVSYAANARGDRGGVDDLGTWAVAGGPTRPGSHDVDRRRRRNSVLDARLHGDPTSDQCSG